MKKYLLIGLVVLSIGLVAAGCDDATAADTSGSSGSTQRQEAAITESNQQKLIQSTPIPQLDHSLERDNLAKRLLLWNDQNKISYIYLINYGKVMAFYTIKGKVSSVNSLLTTPQQIVKDNKCDTWGSGTSCPGQVVDSPDIDGSYGSNGDAIFFFTTEGAYVEWRGDYMLADQPLKLTTQPELVREIK